MPIALITGAAGGIGRATVDVLTSEGWQVVAVDRVSTKDFPEEVAFHQVDAAIEGEVSGLFEWFSEKHDDLNALVNNAAIQISKPLVEMTLEDWDATMASNLRSIFLMTRGAYPWLKKAKGAVVNVGSVHAVATSINIAAYAASKGGVLALTRAMALEFAVDQIRVNAVLPGAVDTQMLRDGLRRGHLKGDWLEDQLENLGQRTVLGRIGEPEEIARAILFLLDNDQSSFMTGQGLVIDGGATARLSTE